jgi:ubiquinone/menaquinone biosynthesis C-methylase UbiE
MEKPVRRRPGPDRAAALAQYRHRAGVYDLELALLEPVRRRAIAWLAPKPGDTVFDVGCGTGLSFELLRAAIGPGGRIIGIEQSPQMIERARQRVRQHGWRNVTLLCAPVESARIPAQADAALAHFTHDILQRDDALGNVLRHLRPGASVVASGLKWAPLWAGALNLLVLPAALRSVSSLAGLQQPWQRLERLLGPLQTRSLLAGTVYVVRGRCPARS